VSRLDGVNEVFCGREPVSLTKKRPFRCWKRATTCASTEYRRNSVAAIRSVPVATVASLTLNTSRAWLVLDRAVPASLSPGTPPPPTLLRPLGEYEAIVGGGF